MNTFAKAVIAVLLCASGSAWSQASPYAGQQDRSIKALSDQEVAALLEGQGAGFAKAAELNGYPGPSHVLELADRLGLSVEQRSATRELMSEHKLRARSLGAGLVDAERELDGLFARRSAAPDAVDAATRRVALLHAELRAEHLKTHLAQTALLTPQQVRRYHELRGYGDAAGGQRGGAHKHH
jgi:Spy/CpxP family protein refolding chaperone